MALDGHGRGATGPHTTVNMTTVPVANVVDANFSVVVKAPKALLPAVDAFDGIHADLVGRARSFGSI